MIAAYMNCPHCHATNRTGAHFCRRCGILLGSHCPRCRQERPADADFCDNCGLPLSPRASFGWDRFGWAVADESEKRAALRPVEAASNLLRQYIPQEVRSKLDAAQASGGMVGERRIVTMLFCDVKGSTAMAGQLDPEEWAEMMKGTVQHLVTRIPLRGHGGPAPGGRHPGLLRGADRARGRRGTRGARRPGHRRGDPRLPDARGARARPVARCAGRGERRYAWRILAALAEIERESADASSAQTLLRQAREIIDQIADRAGRPELRETFLDSPAVRAVLARSA